MKITELTMQAVLMNWLMNNRAHIYVLPNSNQFFYWEADLLSVTKAGLCHEFEIKISLADYKRDAAKHKHHLIGGPGQGPAYFWYATHGFEIDPPEKAGWIEVKQRASGSWVVEVRKEAPRIGNWKITEDKRVDWARLLSWRLTNFYQRFTANGDTEKHAI